MNISLLKEVFAVSALVIFITFFLYGWKIIPNFDNAIMTGSYAFSFYFMYQNAVKLEIDRLDQNDFLFKVGWPIILLIFTWLPASLLGFALLLIIGRM